MNRSNAATQMATNTQDSLRGGGRALDIFGRKAPEPAGFERQLTELAEPRERAKLAIR